jgi:O-antigen ligase
MHNNYLDTWLSMGITGLILFVMAFIIMPLKIVLKEKEWLYFAIIICFNFSMFSETYMDRTTGNIILGFFFGLLAAFNNEKLKVDQ